MKRSNKYLKNLEKSKITKPPVIKAKIQEVIDTCLEKGLITPIQRDYGLKLRWLHTLKYGLPNIKSNFPMIYSKSSDPRDPKWIAKQQSVYKEVLNHLKINNVLNIIVDVCIYNTQPSFIISPSSRRAIEDFSKFKLGMEFLEEIFEKLSKAH